MPLTAIYVSIELCNVILYLALFTDMHTFCVATDIKFKTKGPHKLFCRIRIRYKPMLWFRETANPMHFWQLWMIWSCGIGRYYFLTDFIGFVVSKENKIVIIFAFHGNNFNFTALISISVSKGQLDVLYSLQVSDALIKFSKIIFTNWRHVK